MEMEEIIGAMESVNNNGSSVNDETTELKREKLISAVMGGGKYIEKKITVEVLNNMSAEEIYKEFDKYEKKLGSVMVKTLGKSLLEVYSSIASYFLPIRPEKKEKLVEDLNQDPFLDHALSRTCCELYHKYGMFLAPLTTSLTTFKYCDWDLKNSKILNNDNNKNGTERSDSDDSGSFALNEYGNGQGDWEGD